MVVDQAQKAFNYKQGEKMKRLLLFISIMGLIGCNTYTVKNDSTEKIQAGDQNMNPGDCKEFYDSFFGLFGDYPIAITKADGTLFEGADEEYFAAHYVVKDGSITEVEERCEKPKKPSAAKTNSSK